MVCYKGLLCREFRLSLPPQKYLIMNSKDQSGKRPRIRKTDDRNIERQEKPRFSKPYGKEEDDSRKPERRPYKSSGNKDQRATYGRADKDRSGNDRSYPKPHFNKDRRSADSEKDAYRERPSGRDGRNFDRSERDDRTSSDRSSSRPQFAKERRSSDSEKGSFKERSSRGGRRDFDRPQRDEHRGKEQYGRKSYSRKAASPKGFEREDNGLIRLNKYLADSGVCSRREADKLIEAGAVTVNGKVVTQLGTKVSRDDKVAYGGQTLRREVLRYVLLNKPKGFLTTADDPMDRKTVMELVSKACDERIYPVGRLDRNTLGLLLLTNDGELAKKLTHPKYGVKKLYHVTLDKALTKNDLLKIADGIELEDGPIKADAIAWVTGVESKKEVGIELHSGRNRIVRRIFESLGYKVEKLDRVRFASLTKINLPRGHWRHLSEKEVSMLKMLK